MNKVEQVRDFLKYFNTNAYKEGFFEALLLHERLAPIDKEINANVVEKASEIIDDYETIFDYDLRDDIDNLKDMLTPENEFEVERSEMNRRENLKPFSFDINLNGKITIEVFAENKEQAKQMVDDVLENSNFKQVLERSKNNVSLDMKLKEKEMER